MDLSRLVISETSEEQIVILQEVGGPRAFSIVIGFLEAVAIDRNLKLNGKAPRPLTHDLMQSIIRDLGATLEKIIVHDLKDRTFYAKLVLTRAAKTIEVDARPSDAIALAVQARVPIFVEERVIEAVGSEAKEDEEEGGGGKGPEEAV